MDNLVYTKSTSKHTSDILYNFIIDTNDITRRIFRATVVDNPKDSTACISGVILHQRKSKNNEWEDVESINLSTLKAGEGVKLSFGCTQMKELRDIIEQAYSIGSEGVQPNFAKFITGKEDEVLFVKGKEQEYIKQLLNQNFGETIWKELVDMNPDLATKISYSRIQSNRQSAVKEFENNINLDKPEGYWQKFFSKNDWIFGYGLAYNFLTTTCEQAYVGGKNINYTNGQLVDYLSNSNGNSKFTVLIEIKKSNAPLLNKVDRNRCYPISSDLAGAVSQIQGYCQTWGTNVQERYEFEKETNILTCQPKGIIIIGNTFELDNDDKKKSFELFRRNMHNPEIVTFDELLERAKFIVRDNNTTVEVHEDTDFDDDGIPF